MGGGGALRMMIAMSDDDDSGKRSYGSDTMLTMRRINMVECPM